MAPVLSAEGEKINWINYKTGEKDIRFHMYADTKEAGIAIQFTHRDAGIRTLYFEQLTQLKPILHEALNEEWQWFPEIDMEGRPRSAVVKETNGINVLNRADWPALISFFKPRIIALDEFWSAAKYAFETLR
jgi:hypothetical protein